MQLARDNLEREPIRAALSRLDTAASDPLARAHLSALRGQLYGELEAGNRAAAALREVEFIRESGNPLEDIKRSLGWLSVLAMLRDHSAMGGVLARCHRAHAFAL